MEGSVLMKNWFRLATRIQAPILVAGLLALRESYGDDFLGDLLLTEGSR